MSKLAGKSAIVTGSGRGIGREVALKLASEGARVVVNDLDADPAAEVVELIRAQGGEAVACVGSVTAPDFADRLVKTAVEHHKGIDIIINNAGYTWDNVIQKMTDEQWYAILDCHLTAPFRILRAAQPVISAAAKAEAAEGREVFRKIVNISSGAAGGNPGQSNYSAAKAGILGMTKTLAKEWGRLKVNVNAVAFGLIETRLTQALAGDQSKTVNIEGREIKVGVQQAMLDGVSRMTPLGRAGKPEEAAGAVYLFCTPESNFLSGQVVYCGGGPGGNF
ncbi:3-oxoacyl-[acyl-carrier-protein] reductase [Cupriavidus campinensis]|jgi:3-oxoacyl-[acyl-carrier protein] reductase|uniref:SDR family oxidoreductase n=1 Tax=Cupriavidus campinensis TaxID=151783 RepID=A0AAE9I7J7_9BURK|nr:MULTISPECIES: SDR family oxidoreductase [Cupriavidus]TSP13363.1 SDR family oxidoreductase [Cupriavidus campinensis]URF07726.1 SDR family oxidoreductase [Cupriavidus campinensis]CAG2147856.1 3-oxoacyl-[acyl-carrier-protein] reductase [Cupriavidus campinensis]SFC99113.1 3-oxoacyl-[acyl-carrier protein] reductase [Cupriavidus sp. OV038]SFP62335.1 3-oxoacyl-[acyl-carrier protein] reductase [Cupriavidus sp. OV096]